MIKPLSRTHPADHRSNNSTGWRSPTHSSQPSGLSGPIRQRLAPGSRMNPYPTSTLCWVQTILPQPNSTRSHYIQASYRQPMKRIFGVQSYWSEDFFLERNTSPTAFNSHIIANSFTLQDSCPLVYIWSPEISNSVGIDGLTWWLSTILYTCIYCTLLYVDVHSTLLM
jgi:hypothetical protein